MKLENFPFWSWHVSLLLCLDTVWVIVRVVTWFGSINGKCVQFESFFSSLDQGKTLKVYMGVYIYVFNIYMKKSNENVIKCSIGLHFYA